MNALFPQDLTPVAIKRLLYLLNQSRTVRDFLQIDLKSVLLSPDAGKDYGIGEAVAQRIIQRREELPNRRFTQLSELDNIAGLGKDKIDDLVQFCSIPRAELFLRAMRSYVLPSNFELAYTSIPFEAAEPFLDSEEIFREWLMSKILEGFAREEKLTEEDLFKLAMQLQNAYVDEYEDGYIGSFAFALWFMRYDADNWFTFEQVREQTERYLQSPFTGDNQFLQFYKGVENGRFFTGGIAVKDLPVTFNYDEQTYTIWVGRLFD